MGADRGKNKKNKKEKAMKKKVTIANNRKN